MDRTNMDKQDDWTNIDGEIEQLCKLHGEAVAKKWHLTCEKAIMEKGMLEQMKADCGEMLKI
jgi:hypothetical protein